MKWENLERSTNVIDKRKKRNKIIGAIAGLTAIVSTFIYGPNLPEYINSAVKEDNKYTAEAKYTDEIHAEFIKAMLFITEDSWGKIFKSKNLTYKNTNLVLFTDSITSACGHAGFDIGPFYCSGDSTVYMDLDFFDLLSKNLKVIGDASQAYVVFHEVGHHVQNLLHVLPSVYLRMKKYPEKDANNLLVRLELQADCYAGIIFNKSKKILEPGDIAEVVNAASRIGDDWLQSRSGKAMPDTFTHGTSEQRAGWLLHGYKNGTMESCDTFSQPDTIIKS